MATLNDLIVNLKININKKEIEKLEATIKGSFSVIQKDTKQVSDTSSVFLTVLSSIGKAIKEIVQAVALQTIEKLLDAIIERSEVFGELVETIDEGLGSVKNIVKGIIDVLEGKKSIFDIGKFGEVLERIARKIIEAINKLTTQLIFLVDIIQKIAFIIKVAILGSFILFFLQLRKSNSQLKLMLVNFFKLGKATKSQQKIFKVIPEALKKIRKGFNKFVGVIGKGIKEIKDIVGGLPGVLENAFKGFIAKQILLSVFAFTKATAGLAAQIENATIKLGNFVRQADLKGIEDIFSRITSATKGWFTEAEFKNAATEFLRVGGTVKDFDKIISGLSKKSIALGLNLGEVLTSFQQSLESGDITSFFKKGLVARQDFLLFKQTVKGADEETKKFLTRQFLMSKGVALSRIQLKAFNKTVISYSGGLRRVSAQLNDLKAKVADLFKDILFGAEILANILLKLRESPLFLSVARLLTFLVILSSAMITVISFTRILIFLNKTFGITGIILSILNAKFFILLGLISLVFLIFEDLWVGFRGGESALLKLGEGINSLIDKVPFLKAIRNGIEDIIVKLLEAGTIGLVMGDWEKAIDHLASSLKKSMTAIGEAITSFYNNLNTRMGNWVKTMVKNTIEEIKRIPFELASAFSRFFELSGENARFLGGLASGNFATAGRSPAQDAGSKASIANITNEGNRNITQDIKMDVTIQVESNADGTITEATARSVKEIIEQSINNMATATHRVAQ